MNRQVRLQDLVGRRVVGVDGKVAGRIQEIHATWRGEECLIEEFELGGTALLERLGITHRSEPRRIAWQDLDLGDPQKPRLRK